MRTKMNRMICLLCISLFVSNLYSQDEISAIPKLDMPAGNLKQLREFVALDTIGVHISLPDCFHELTANIIEDENGVLTPVLEKLRLSRWGAIPDSLRILHIGDSHIRGKILPGTAGDKLMEAFGKVKYMEMGVNGATCITFTHPLRIQAIIDARPDLLILSFGTNESHNRRYNSYAHYRQMDELISLIKKDLPGVPLLFTTPPGSYESFRSRNRRRTYSINPRTTTAVDTIRLYAQNHKIAVWDMYNILGGSKRACKNWNEAGLMRPDHVHYMPDAYKLQGELLFEAIVNAYNAYVTF